MSDVIVYNVESFLGGCDKPMLEFLHTLYAKGLRKRLCLFWCILEAEETSSGIDHNHAFNGISAMINHLAGSFFVGWYTHQFLSTGRLLNLRLYRYTESGLPRPCLRQFLPCIPQFHRRSRPTAHQRMDRLGLRRNNPHSERKTNVLHRGNATLAATFHVFLY